MNEKNCFSLLPLVFSKQEGTEIKNYKVFFFCVRLMKECSFRLIDWHNYLHMKNKNYFNLLEVVLKIIKKVNATTVQIINFTMLFLIPSR